MQEVQRGVDVDPSAPGLSGQALIVGDQRALLEDGRRRDQGVVSVIHTARSQRLHDVHVIHQPGIAEAGEPDGERTRWARAGRNRRGLATAWMLTCVNSNSSRPPRTAARNQVLRSRQANERVHRIRVQNRFPDDRRLSGRPTVVPGQHPTAPK
jgi:hypothetical protein